MSLTIWTYRGVTLASQGPIVLTEHFKLTIDVKLDRPCKSRV